MAHPVRKFQITKGPTGPSPITPEQRYWKGFKSAQNVSFQSPVTHISYPPPPVNPLQSSANDYFVATSGTRVQIYSIKTRALVKTISRFTDIAHCGEIRRDGRLLVAGDETGKVQVFDVQSRAILKTWDEHKQPVWVTKFSPHKSGMIMSTSDDRTVRLWDLPSNASVATFNGHTDYVRCGNILPGTMSNLIISGSYDGTVRIWDPRLQGKATMIFKHAAPVEEVISMSSGTHVIAAADNQISVLDIVAARPLHILKNHQKTVTSLCLSSKGTRLVSGGLDGHIKIYETSSWNIVHGSKYPSPVLAVSVISTGVNNEDKHLVVGMQSGMMSIKTKLSGQERAKQREREKEMQALISGNLEQHDKLAEKRARGPEKKLRGIDFVGEGAAVIIEGQEHRKRKTETSWEKDLRTGKFSQALDQALEKNLSSITILSLLTELRHRNALRTTLEGRDELTVQPIFKWVTKHLTDPRYVNICTDVSLILLDLYSEHVSDSVELEKTIRALDRRVRTEVARTQQACQINGMLKMLSTELH
ncbi:unnamed protein product [Blumeria hordei]|uniref:U3 small nucleolar RNA-associated protein 15 C-terminal domain-containing protein n=1 Tax=Blumeria hordei TaxID=2867405 RepID=A0A383V375_BLUHO|nr:unnamed protein product [Blumeria hordei]